MTGRIVLAATLILVLAACDGGKKPQDRAVAIDVEQEAAAFFSQNPGAKAALLLNNRGKGFEIYEDGKAVFIAFGASSNLRIGTGVESVSDNEICFRRVENWSGACMEMFRNQDGTIFVDGAFGNGARLRQTLTLSVLR